MNRLIAILKRIFLDGLMISALILTLFPIAWMVITSLKNNNDILVGKLGFSQKANSITQIIPVQDAVWLSSINGYVGIVTGNQLTEVDNKSVVASAIFLDSHSTVMAVNSSGILPWNLQNHTPSSAVRFSALPYDVTTRLLRSQYARAGRFVYVAQGITTTESDRPIDSPAVKMRSGLMVFDPNFQYVKTLTTADYLRSNAITAIQADPDGLVWIGTDNGLNTVDSTTNAVISEYSTDDGLPEGRIVDIIPQASRVIIASRRAISILDRSSDEIHVAIRLTTMGDINCVEWIDGLLWIGTTNGLYAANIQSGHISGYFVDQPLHWSVSAIAKGTDGLWVGRDDGRVIHLNSALQVVNTWLPKRGGPDIRFVNYWDMWRNIAFGTYLKNSVIICGVTVFLSLILSTLAGYSLARFRFPGSSLFSSGILATQMVPMLMYLIPIYLMFIKFREYTGIQVVGTYTGIIFVYATFFVPMSIWILRSFFVSIPIEIEEAARIDGCTRFGAFWRIVLPLAAPGIIATGIYIFLVAWDELMFATILLPQQEMLTIPLGIKLYIGNHQNRFDLMMAASTVATLPVLLLFFMVQRWFIKGLTAGAVKG